MTKDEAIKTYIATTRLHQLYDAYRAMYRANGLMILKLSKQLSGDDGVSSQARILAQQDFVQRRADAHAADLSFRLRSEQLNPRVAALKRWQP
ncbi:MAG: hypothetical protein AAGL99_00695 [Pseudomonadota bacterium]